jgi:6-pyruvoyltetrahydropterin/6-carboxytetrahydropterin synthase
MDADNPIYRIRIDACFESAHYLRNYNGGDEPLHGHSWRAEAEIATRQLDDAGIAVDFIEARRALRELTARLDHACINDVPPFDRSNPTAENIAQWLLGELAARLDVPGATVTRVRVQEGPNGEAIVERPYT